MPESEGQSTKNDSQTSKSDNNNNNNNNNNDFVPEKSAKDYADMWRASSAEAAKYRKEKAQLKEDLAQRDKKILEEQGKYKEMYEKSDQELQGLKGGLKTGMKRTALKEQLVELGCNSKMVDKAIKHAELDGIEVDSETYQANVEQIKFEAKRIKEEVPVFFGKATINPKDGTPGIAPQSGKVNLKTMSDKDLDKAYMEALKP